MLGAVGRLRYAKYNFINQGEVPDDATSATAIGFGMFAMRTNVRTLGFGADRRELGVRRL